MRKFHDLYLTFLIVGQIMSSYLFISNLIDVKFNGDDFCL